MDRDDKDLYIVSYTKYVIVWLGLLVLTGITVAASGLDLGGLNALAAIIIASFKALLVAIFFMHLLYEGRLFTVMVLFTILTLAIFIGFTFFDISFR